MDKFTTNKNITILCPLPEDTEKSLRGLSMETITQQSLSSLHILLLEDDPALGSGVQLQLEIENYRVTWAKSLFEAKKLLEENKAGGFDLFVLDVNLPDGTGFDFASWLRSADAAAPIIFLTARTDEDSVVRGFNAGGNDYIRKPFGNMELMARIRNLTSEKRSNEQILRYGDLILMKGQQAVKFNDSVVSFNRREFEILLVFFENPESIITRETLLQRMSSGDEIFDRTVDSHISHIRSKLKKGKVEGYRISSVYGAGYRLEKQS